MKSSDTETSSRAQDIEENELFRAIGEFIFWFSQLEFTIKARLAGALKLEEKLFDIIIGPYDFAILCTVTRETLSVDAGENVRERIKNYFNECHSLNQKARLIVAHGSWTIGGARHVSRNTLKASVHFEEPQQIDKYTAQAKQLMRNLFSLGATHR